MGDNLNNSEQALKGAAARLKNLTCAQIFTMVEVEGDASPAFEYLTHRANSYRSLRDLGYIEVGSAPNQYRLTNEGRMLLDALRQLVGGVR